MTTTPFMPNTDNGKADLLDHLANTLPSYAGLLSLSAESLAALAACRQLSLYPSGFGRYASLRTELDGF